MKTLHLLIFGMIGLTVVALVGFLLFTMESMVVNKQQSVISLLQDNSSSTLIVEGLNDTYFVGQPINFDIMTTSKVCSIPSVSIKNEKGTTIWTSRQNMLYCEIGVKDWTNLPHSWHLNQGDLGNLVIYKNGTYMIIISFLGSTVEKNLQIIHKSVG